MPLVVTEFAVDVREASMQKNSPKRAAKRKRQASPDHTLAKRSFSTAHLADDDLLTDYELDMHTGRARSCWQKDRLVGGGCPWVRVGPRLVRYRWGDVKAWLAAHRRTSTSDVGPTPGEVGRHAT
jgi:hypothetical protein